MQREIKVRAWNKMNNYPPAPRNFKHKITMRTLQKDGRTLQPEDIYLDLSKLSEEDIKSIPDILKRNEERISFYVDEMLPSNKMLSVYFANDYGLWTVAQKSSLTELAEISYPEFLQLFGESELTELPQEKIQAFKNGTWYIRGGEEMQNYFRDNGFLFDANSSSLAFVIVSSIWSVRLVKNLSDHTEITLADYKRLSGSAENAHTENPTPAENAHTENPTPAENAHTENPTPAENAQTENPTPAENAQTENPTPAENAQTENHLADAFKMSVDFGKENLQVPEHLQMDVERCIDFLKGYGYFVFPKAPEGEFPDLTNFKGVKMHSKLKQNSDIIEKNIIAKVYFENYADQNNYITSEASAVCEVRPIQKTKPTIQHLWKLAEEAGADLSEFEKPE